MEFDILNEIIFNTVGGLFRRTPTVQPGLRDVSALINKPLSHPQPQPQQQPDKIATSVRHESTILPNILSNLPRKEVFWRLQWQ